MFVICCYAESPPGDSAGTLFTNSLNKKIYHIKIAFGDVICLKQF